jgi:hypothetical protein
MVVIIIYKLLIAIILCILCFMRVVSVFLIFVLLASQAAFAVQKHYCGGELVSAGILAGVSVPDCGATMAESPTMVGCNRASQTAAYAQAPCCINEMEHTQYSRFFDWSLDSKPYFTAAILPSPAITVSVYPSASIGVNHFIALHAPLPAYRLFAALERFLI